MCQKYVYCMPLYVRTDWCCAVYVIKLELSRIKYVKQNNPLRGEMGQDIHLGWYRGPSSTMVNNVRELHVSHKLMIKMQNKPQYNSMWRICLFVMLLISFWYFIIKSLFTAKSLLSSWQQFIANFSANCKTLSDFYWYLACRTSGFVAQNA